MPEKSSSAAQLFAAVIAITAWIAVSTQCYLFMEMRINSIPETIIRFFSFFTVLSNLVVALCFTGLLLNNDSKLFRFFSSPSAQTAVTVYIIVVGAVYNLILRFIWNPEGLQQVIDELLHSVIPVLCLIFWICFTSKKSLQWQDSLQWMIYPSCYSIFIAIRGAISGFYPYPFVNVTALGYPRALLNAGVLVLVFMGLSLFLIAIAKLLSKRK